MQGAMLNGDKIISLTYELPDKYEVKIEMINPTSDAACLHALNYFK